MISADPGDKEYSTEVESQLVWAIGKLDSNKEPAFHSLYPRTGISVKFSVGQTYRECIPFTTSNKELQLAWDRPKIIDRALRVYTATLGPAGGRRGYQGITG